MTPLKLFLSNRKLRARVRPIAVYAPPNSPTNMGKFPKDAAEFLRSVEDLFRNKYPVFVLDHDVGDDTFLICWTDGRGVERRSWVTDEAMEELSARWTMN
jgi:hypothetical protein